MAEDARAQLEQVHRQLEDASRTVRRQQSRIHVLEDKERELARCLADTHTAHTHQAVKPASLCLPVDQFLLRGVEPRAPRQHLGMGMGMGGEGGPMMLSAGERSVVHIALPDCPEGEGVYLQLSSRLSPSIITSRGLCDIITSRGLRKDLLDSEVMPPAREIDENHVGCL